MATHSSILASRIPWTEEPSWLQSMGLQRVGHHWATNTQYSPLSVSVDFTFTVSTNELPFSWISECRTLSTEGCTAPLYLQDLSCTNFGVCRSSQNQSPYPFPLYTEREDCANFHCVEEDTVAYRSVNWSRLQISWFSFWWAFLVTKLWMSIGVCTDMCEHIGQWVS